MRVHVDVVRTQEAEMSTTQERVYRAEWAGTRYLLSKPIAPCWLLEPQDGYSGI